MTTLTLSAAADWSINPAATSVKHKTGLQIHYEKGPQQKKLQLNIDGIQKLTGTVWEAKANLLIEQGILLLEKIRS